MKRPKRYIPRCKACGSIHHGKFKDPCPYCDARGQHERILVNALTRPELLLEDDNIIEVNST